MIGKKRFLGCLLLALFGVSFFSTSSIIANEAGNTPYITSENCELASALLASAMKSADKMPCNTNKSRISRFYSKVLSDTCSALNNLFASYNLHKHGESILDARDPALWATVDLAKLASNFIAPSRIFDLEEKDKIGGEKHLEYAARHYLLPIIDSAMIVGRAYHNKYYTEEEHKKQKFLLTAAYGIVRALDGLLESKNYSSEAYTYASLLVYHLANFVVVGNKYYNKQDNNEENKIATHKSKLSELDDESDDEEEDLPSVADKLKEIDTFHWASLKKDILHKLRSIDPEKAEGFVKHDLEKLKKEVVHESGESSWGRSNEVKEKHFKALIAKISTQWNK